MPVMPDNDWNFEPLTNDVMFHLAFLNNEKRVQRWSVRF